MKFKKKKNLNFKNYENETRTRITIKMRTLQMTLEMCYKLVK